VVRACIGLEVFTLRSPRPKCAPCLFLPGLFLQELRVGSDASQRPFLPDSDLFSLQGYVFASRAASSLRGAVDDHVTLGPSVRCGSPSSAPAVQQPSRYGIGRFMSCDYWLLLLLATVILVRHYMAELSSRDTLKPCPATRCLAYPLLAEYGRGMTIHAVYILAFYCSGCEWTRTQQSRSPLIDRPLWRCQFAARNDRLPPSPNGHS
jgi:hypothetical protein